METFAYLIIVLNKYLNLFKTYCYHQANNKAIELSNQGKFSEAIPIAQQALEFAQLLYDGDHPNIAAAFNNLAFLYHQQGQLSQAEYFYQRSLNIIRRIFPDDHVHVATSLDNLAGLLHSQGKLIEAESPYKESLEMRQRLFPGNHPDVARSLNNLATLYYTKEQFIDKAEDLYQEALRMRQELFEGDHADIADSLNNLAALYEMQGKMDEAKLYYEQGLAMRRRLFLDDHPDVAASLNNLAFFYYTQGLFKKAQELYQEAKEMFQRLFSDEDHPDVIRVLNNLALLLAARNLPSESLKLMQQVIAMDDRLLRANFAYSSERDRLLYIDNIRNNFDLFLSLISTYFSDSPEAAKIALDVVLKRKCITATALAAFNFAIYSERYSHLQPEFQRLRSLREQLTHLMFDPPFIQPQEPQEQYRQRRHEHQNLVTELQQECEQIEKQLASQVPEIQLQDQETDRRAVALALPEGSALVEFVRFDVYDFKADKLQPAQYLAFVLPARQPDAVQMILLGDAEPIERLIKVFRETISELRLKDLGLRPKAKPPQQKSYQEAGIKLREAIYNPILKQVNLAEYSHLIIAPDYELCLVPFGILPEEGRLLIDRYKISYLSTGRDILRETIETERPASPPFIMADPDFNLSRSEGFSPQKSPEGLTTNGDESPEGLTTNDVIKRLGGEYFDPLPETGILAETVAQKLGVKPYLQQQALEPLFGRVNCPSILLIATHGYFNSIDSSETKNSSIPPLLSGVRGEQIQGLRNSDRFSTPTIDNSLMRSGLALAGANTWKLGGNLPPEAGKGFLFAQDVAVLDLWANELTILIACESGLGDVKIGEGVLGLRRAFAVSGCKTLVMSLWSVPTKASILLMNQFLDLLKSGYGRYDALIRAQEYIRSVKIEELQQFPLGEEILAELVEHRSLMLDDIKNSPNFQPLAHPYFWAAWVCQGNTTPFPPGIL
ncbi:CHAT domain-containing protein [Planktothrix agardhii 1806]|uniref:CHAT domain-containing protein n=2 Tax=Planktothrix agardhii TaxID=1160 RepID=UPI001F3945E0|nr:CHAT domain-containing tetratricopeptide repeat protein [Planktothrix agardhii]MCF3573104.1 CHAT domain-containing protein [Planktothrix agardhii 1805]MCF3583698.1 CHAT domain-containing protein [Planktothrix agardhii 1803]MCF3604166.1 CHAT domain-containing protein [Planktothrix agardhii 1804]MCF3618453.1 CHAT domain-containing protein [Planktothrix agardhii 1806]MCP9295395.1 CHAT domain-containing protein [Planktothrix agardhii LY1]